MGWLTAKFGIAIFGVASAIAGTVCLSNPATIAMAPIFFDEAEAATVMLATPADPVTVAVAIATGPLTP